MSSADADKKSLPIVPLPQKRKAEYEDDICNTQNDTSDTATRSGVPPEIRQSVNTDDGNSTELDGDVGVQLADEQKAVLKMVIEKRKNVFFTGAAGKFFFFLIPPSRSTNKKH